MYHTKEDNAIHKCYVELFKHSTPSTDFDLLVENANVNDRGQKEIDFMSYEIDEEKYDQIVESTIKEFKIESWKKQQFKNTIALGSSPKFSKK